MTSKSCFSPGECMPAIKRAKCAAKLLVLLSFVQCVFLVGQSLASNVEAPQWMHALTNTQLPTYDEKTEAVLLYSETNVTVLSADKIRTHIRAVYKILRPDGRQRGTLQIYFGSAKKVLAVQGWCIPANGKDYEVTGKDATDFAPPAEGGYLLQDIKAKVLHIPASDPGNIIGYEYDLEQQPFWLQDAWEFQGVDPVLESHYSLQIPPGWVFRTSWISHPEVKPEENGNTLRWTVNNISGIRPEERMPPWQALAGRMIVSFFPSGSNSQKSAFETWQAIGNWFGALVAPQMNASQAIKIQTSSLAANGSLLQKMQALAAFVQHEIRYVAIELGIGGWQPHPAPEVFSHRYGDCKDKATLLRTMLLQIGVDSYHVVINTERGAVGRDTPPHSAFNHVILAIRLPDELKDPSLLAVFQHPVLGRLLFFDPTDEVTPFGQIRGQLQSNYGLLVTPNGGELVQLPQQSSTTNSIRRIGKLTLDPNGTLKGEIQETRLGDQAWKERWRLRTVTRSTDKIKPIETLLGASLSNFQILNASIVNQDQTDQPFGFNYGFQSSNYGKLAGDLLLVRPRVLGHDSSGILETREPRKFPVEFPAPLRNVDTFDIALPPGYQVDELPPPMDVEYSFASYHSKTEATDSGLHYTRSLEIKDLSVELNQMDDLKKFYRIIATDENNVAVLKPVATHKQ